jgi:signal transduction histidine kinase
VRRLAAEARAEMRSLVFQLRPADLEADGLLATLQKHVEVLGRVHPARVELAVRGSGEPDAAVQRELFRIAQEALQNALKHAGASRIGVELDLNPAGTRLTVVDDGAGFDPSDPRVRSQHLGVTVMAERARAVGGRLDLRSSPGAGTTVAVEVARG